MPRIADRNKDYFKNPIKNLFDLFIYISRILRSEYFRYGEDYSLQKLSLSVDFHRQVELEKIYETIRIGQIWNDSSEEKIIYTSNYIDQDVYEEIQRRYLMSSAMGNEIFLHHLKLNRLVKYMDKESFIGSIQFLQLPHCTLEYETNNLGRGLQAFSSLKFSKSDYWSEEDEQENPFITFFSEMIELAERISRIRLEQNPKKWAEYLKIKKCEFGIPFRERIDEVDPPWIIGYYLVDLCKFYSENMLLI